MRESTFCVVACKCGCTAFWASSLTLFESFMFWAGFWKRPDLTNVEAVAAPLGGEVNAQRNRLEQLSAKES